MSEEEEVLAEVEAVQAVYGDDCTVFDHYPPYLHVHIKPRTADISSQQFVEAILSVRGSLQYPNEPPQIDLIETKGLDIKRQKHLKNCIRDKACELSSCLMLVSLIEEAVERLSIMNHPDGDCPMCLYPLVSENDESSTLPFMKLMSCFHCFHCECIIRWWNWLQTQKEETSSSSSTSAHFSRGLNHEQDVNGTTEEIMALCPVCRKVFHADDFEHVQDLLGTQTPLKTFHEAETVEDQQLIESNSEKTRRENYEAILRLQQENSGIIEPRKDLLVLPGMFLPQTTTITTTTTTITTTTSTSTATLTGDTDHEQHGKDPSITSETTISNCAANKTGPSTHRKNARARKHRVPNSRKQDKQWIKKDNGFDN